MSPRLDGKVALVTGASRGIGKAIAAAFVDAGARVMLSSRKQDALEAAASTIKGETAVFAANAGDPDAAAACIDATIDRLGGLDILINNAGITRDKMFHNLDDETFDLVMDVNLRTAFHATLAAVGYMRAQAKSEIASQGAPDHHRKIVLTSSVAALTGNPGQFNYPAAKGAVIATTKTLARELGPFGINVNAVAPGFIETRLTAAKSDGDELGVPEGLRQMAVGMIAVGRAGRPEDVAAVHAFLASPDSDFVSGVTIPVTGGQFGGMG